MQKYTQNIMQQQILNYGQSCELTIVDRSYPFLQQKRLSLGLCLQLQEASSGHEEGDADLVRRWLYSPGSDIH